MPTDNPEISIKQTFASYLKSEVKSQRRVSCRRVRLLGGMDHHLKEDGFFLVVIYMCVCMIQDTLSRMCGGIYTNSLEK